MSYELKNAPPIHSMIFSQPIVIGSQYFQRLTRWEIRPQGTRFNVYQAMRLTRTPLSAYEFFFIGNFDTKLDAVCCVINEGNKILNKGGQIHDPAPAQQAYGLETVSRDLKIKIFFKNAARQSVHNWKKTPQRFPDWQKRAAAIPLRLL